MRRRYSLDGEHYADREGNRLPIYAIRGSFGVVTSLTIDDASAAPGEGGTIGGLGEDPETTTSDGSSSESSTSTGGGTGEPFEPAEIAAFGKLGGKTARDPRDRSLLVAAVDYVWAHYVAAMQPRATEAGEDERKIIRNALKVATAGECCVAIKGCASSPFHMGENDKRKPYKRLSQILKGRQGRETTRERIDFFIDIAKKAGVESSVPTAPSARIRDAKQAVLDGWQFPGDALVVSQGEEAATWLASQGYRINLDPETGRPTFEAPS